MNYQDVIRYFTGSLTTYTNQSVTGLSIMPNYWTGDAYSGNIRLVTYNFWSESTIYTTVSAE